MKSRVVPLILAAVAVVAIAATAHAQAPSSDAPTTFSFGTLGAQIVEWVAAAFSIPIGAVLTAWITRLFKKAGVEYTQQMSDQLDKTIVNGLNDGAVKSGALMQGTASVQVKNQIIQSAIKYAQDHRAETIQALGFDPQSGAAVEAIKARIATLVADPSVPTPIALDPPKVA